jgi:hypothetical protein
VKRHNPADEPPVPAQGIEQVWGFLMGSTSDDPAEMAAIRRQRRTVLLLMVALSMIATVALIVSAM